MAEHNVSIFALQMSRVMKFYQHFSSYKSNRRSKIDLKQTIASQAFVNILSLFLFI